METKKQNFSNDNDFLTVMKPGKYVLFLRTCKIWQFIRFIVLNIKMLLVVRKSH